MAHDELDIARRFKAEIRALVKRYPGLVSEEAQTRLHDYICIQTEMENTPMPAKGQRTFQEDLILATVRLPKSDMDAVDRHIETLQRQHRFTGWSRSDALRDLIQRGLDSLTTSSPTAPLVEPAATTAGGAIPPAPAYEARALNPDLEDDLEDQPLGPEPPRTMEPSAVTQASAVLPPAPKRLGRKPVLREPILALLRENPDGLTAAQLKVYLDTEKPIGDTLAGMVKAALLVKDGSGKAVRYLLADAALAPSRH